MSRTSKPKTDDPAVEPPSPPDEYYIALTHDAKWVIEDVAQHYEGDIARMLKIALGLLKVVKEGQERGKAPALLNPDTLGEIELLIGI